MDSTGAGGSLPISLSEDGVYAAQINGKELIIHLNPVSSSFQEVEIVKLKDTPSRFLKFTRRNPALGAHATGSRRESVGRRLLCASDLRILVWDLEPLLLHAEIENIEPGALAIDFGGDENEVMMFHSWNTKLTIYALDSGRSQVIKAPKFSHYHGFGYRPKTRQFAILLKPETSDILTIHEFRSYELIQRINLPTADAQGLKWSPDGKWIAVWDAASAGTKVLIYTADGKLFRTYNGLPEADSVLDLGVRSIEWSPLTHSRCSDWLAIGKVDGTIDILKTKTFSCSTSLSHIFPIDQPSPNAWHERFSTADGNLGYTELPTSTAFSMISESSGPPRGPSIMTFSADGNFLCTVDQTRPNIVWIWDLQTTSSLVATLVHEHPIRQVVWHQSRIEFLVTTANGVLPAIRHWSPNRPPSIVTIPVSRSENGRYDVRWVSLVRDDVSLVWFGTPEEYVLGNLPLEEGIEQFTVLNAVSNKGSIGQGSNMSK